MHVDLLSSLLNAAIKKDGMSDEYRSTQVLHVLQEEPSIAHSSHMGSSLLHWGMIVQMKSRRDTVM